MGLAEKANVGLLFTNAYIMNGQHGVWVSINNSLSIHTRDGKKPALSKTVCRIQTNFGKLTF